VSKPTIAVVGASADRRKFGNKAVRAYAHKGYLVYPIHPREGEIEGHQVYRTVGEIPALQLDRISIYLPPAVALRALDDLTSKPVRQVWLNPGTDSPEVIARARELGLPVVVGCSIVDIGVDPHAEV
jgi:predicted CoA-binding protein